jgi:FdhE protein
MLSSSARRRNIDLQARLDAAAKRHPDARAWLTLLATSLHELDMAVWAGVRPQAQTDRPVEAPLLAGATLTLDQGTVRHWVRRLLRQAAKVAGANPTPLVGLNPRRFDPVPAFEAAVCLDDDRLSSLARTAGADSRGLGALMQLATMPLLQACGRDFAPQVPVDWSYGYCPVCGGWPTLAEVRGLERTYRWRCGRCGGDWGGALLHCPYCGEADHHQLGSLVAEGDAEACSVSACMTCKGYVKVRTTLQATPAYAVLLEDLAMVEWDVVALERGYTRPAQPGYRFGVRFIEPPGRRRTFFHRRS